MGTNQEQHPLDIPAMLKRVRTLESDAITDANRVKVSDKGIIRRKTIA